MEQLNLSIHKFKLPEFLIETPSGTKHLIFDVNGNLKKAQPSAKKGRSLEEAKDEHDTRMREIRRRILMRINQEFFKSQLQVQSRIWSHIQNQASPRASDPDAMREITELQSSADAQESQAQEICRHIQSRQWDKLIPFADELISQINRGTVSASFLSVLSEYTECIWTKNIFMDRIIEIITTLLNDIAVFAKADNTADALDAANLIRELLLSAE